MAKGRRFVAGASGEPRRRPPRVGVVLFALSLLFFGVNFAQEWWVGHQVQQQAAWYQQQISATEKHNKQLLSDIAYFSSKSYITRHAREIGMARPTDTLLVFEQGSPQAHTVHVTRHAPVPENILTRLLHVVFQ